MEKRTTIQCGQSVADKLRKYEIAFGKNRDEMLTYLMDAIKAEFVKKLEEQIADMKAQAEVMPAVVTGTHPHLVMLDDIQDEPSP